MAKKRLGAGDVMATSGKIEVSAAQLRTSCEPSDGGDRHPRPSTLPVPARCCVECAAHPLGMHKICVDATVMALTRCCGVVLVVGPD